MKMDANKFFDKNAEKKEETIPKKVLKRNWECILHKQMPLFLLLLYAAF